MNETKLTLQNDSLRKRYIYKLLTNLVGFLIGLVTQVIIPRGLGPKYYGDYSFLTNFFTQVVSFLDMGSSTAFYTKLSRRPKEHELVRFYLYWIAVVLVVTLALVGLTQIKSIYERIWPHQPLLFIYFAAGIAFITWVLQVLSQMADAYGLTVRIEIARMSQKILGMFFILGLFYFHKLNLIHFFYYNYVIMVFLAIWFIWIIQSNTDSLINNVRFSIKQVKKYILEFYDYSNPLFVFFIVGLVAGILDRWLLQVYAGSVQQGFYGLSYQIGTICFLFTSAMTPLLMREFSIAYGMADLSKMAALFRRFVPMLYAVAAYFSCFIAIQADKVGYIFGGNKYAGATVVIMIMAFYPIHQTYGQMCASVFFAAGKTRLYRNIGVLFSFIGLPVTYFLLAPPEYCGLNVGAAGLAIKMVLLQMVGVNVQLFYCARTLKLDFWKFLWHQAFSAGVFITIAGLVTYAVDKLLFQGGGTIANFILAGLGYSILVIIIIYSYPRVMGIYRQDITSIIQRLRRVFG